ncbi:recombinase family protein [Streptomyces sp. NPDC047000]|uniref:recombinase family protein n=1 Tax=Streptomyces sp. NPDC047000 TaxID=3155474 RepID=UPI0033DCD367
MVHISDMFRLERSTGHLLDMLDVLHRDRLALRIHDGVLQHGPHCRHPRIEELLSTVKFMVQALATAGELQLDLQRELTYDGLRAAKAKGNKGGRRLAIAADKADVVRTGYLEGGPSPPLPATTTSTAEPSAPLSLAFCPSTSPTRLPWPRTCASPSTCPARSPTSAALPN